MSINSLWNRAKRTPGLSQIVDAIPPSMRNALRGAVDKAAAPSTLERVRAQAHQTNELLACLLYEQAMSSPRFQEDRRLLRYGFKVYSQRDEDGLIEEIFNRIGVTDRFFVEFGAGDGLENCTAYCLLKGWSGAWIDGNAACYEQIVKNFGFLIEQKRLHAKYSFITAENIQALFQELGVPAEFDLLSIDLDRNDYWIWKAITRYKPRVVAIEYNAAFNQGVACTVPYNATGTWDQRTNYFGASLKALEYLGREKGYCLVGCTYAGVTAFFVREDCMLNHFASPYTSENHYEPARFFVGMPNGHLPAFGPMVTIETPGQ